MRSKQILGSTLLTAITLLWGTFIIYGAQGLLRYEKTPATSGSPPVRWPKGSRILPPKDKFTLVMLAHPNCPCTRASLAELEIVMARLPGKLAVFVLFRKPGAEPEEAKSSDLWRKAAAIPGVSAAFDENGAETARFGGQASGQTMLYDTRGMLVFSGGLTSARGHQGGNAGVEAVIRLTNGSEVHPAAAPVFGCSLHDPTEKLRQKDPSWKK